MDPTNSLQSTVDFIASPPGGILAMFAVSTLTFILWLNNSLSGIHPIIMYSVTWGITAIYLIVIGFEMEGALGYLVFAGGIIMLTLEYQAVRSAIRVKREIEAKE